jgi:hypothetical protein
MPKDANLVGAVNLLLAIRLASELPLGHLEAVHHRQQLLDSVCLCPVLQLVFLRCLRGHTGALASQQLFQPSENQHEHDFPSMKHPKSSALQAGIPG